MLNYLNKNEYDLVTKQELLDIVNKLSARIRALSNDVSDTGVSSRVIDKVAKMVKPVKGVDYRDGKDGTNYVLTDADRQTIAQAVAETTKRNELSELITSDELMKLIKSYQGENKLLFDDIRGSKKYIQRINELVGLLNEQNNVLDTTQQELLFVKKKLDAVSIDIAQGSPSIQKKYTCETTNPTTQGEIDGYTNGSHWYNQSDNQLFIFMCGQWIEIPLTPVPPASLKLLLDEDGRVVLDENNNALAINE